MPLNKETKPNQSYTVALVSISELLFLLLIKFLIVFKELLTVLILILFRFWFRFPEYYKTSLRTQKMF